MVCQVCGRVTPSPRAKFCIRCFQARAASAGAQSRGNRSACGSIGNAGGGGSIGNAGNVRRGRVKKRSGKGGGQRSGLRRSAKRALVVKKEWLDLLLAGRKTWEIRGMATTRRGWVHFAQSKAGGQLVGRARLVDCSALGGASGVVSEAAFTKSFRFHRVPSLKVVPYKRPYAWVFEQAERFDKPFKYQHRQGAVIWVDV